jgi:hypothetical protein
MRDDKLSNNLRRCNFTCDFIQHYLFDVGIVKHSKAISPQGAHSDFVRIRFISIYCRVQRALFFRHSDLARFPQWNVAVHLKLNPREQEIYSRHTN